MKAYGLRAVAVVIITTIINVMVYYIGDAAGATVFARPMHPWIKGCAG